MQAHDQNLAEQLRDLKQQLEQLQTHGQPAGFSSQCVQLRIPKFNKTNPQLWFSQLDRLFHLHNVTDYNKFDIISVNLEEIQRVLDKFAESSDSKLKRLLGGGETVGKKPSEILDHMRRLAPTTGCEAVIRSLFLAKLPNSIRPFISVWDENNLYKLAEIADKMLEASEPVSAFVESTALTEQQHQVDALSGKQTGMSEVTSALRALTTKVDKLKDELRQSKHAQLSRHTHDSSNDVGSKLCFYHTRFGENARKCQPACPLGRVNLFLSKKS
ncbi:uncharacterized protein LOC133836794 [Drosophila sulfurigaster albostrigata]|uniref:uncharacterized protein LOC133836794 n=1 Tax=Drosophila sulfurigaster albostrigata TaxID=89887 RepID=UPI002D218DAE|nr:uncharacterized protein LOC133836794 [Drosophila sulfurigaster albostrigata]